MFDNIENLELVDIIRGLASVHRFYTDRPTHGFVFKINGESIYNFENRSLTLKEGEMLFVPKGSDYEVIRTSKEESAYLLINFNADIDNAKPQLYSLDGFLDTDFIYNDLVKLWLFGGKSERYKCLSVFYNVLSFIVSIETSRYSFRKNFGKIDPAVNYLQSHIFDCDLKVEGLHKYCGISDTYFRKIFKANFGLSPQEYIINKRMSAARSIIMSGDFNSISQVALSVGYNDPLYFSRLFSKKYGACPSAYIQK